MTDDLKGLRVLVVGASSGIGRAIGVQAAGAGAAVAFAARRKDHLDEAVGEAGKRCVAITCDVRNDAEVEALVAQAIEAFGGLDVVIYATGSSPLAPLPDADGDVWRGAFETNAIGAALVLRAALPHLRAAEHGRAMVLSSHSVEDPWPGLIPYVVSKAALDALVEGWRSEIPDVPLSRIVVGPTMTDFAAGWDEGIAGEMFTRWAEEGRLPENPTVMTADEVAAEVLHALTSPVAVTDLRVLPHGLA